MTVDLDEEQRQMILLALAELSLRRPGWHAALGDMASQFCGREMYDAFRKTSDDIVPPIPFNPALLSSRDRHQILDSLMACWMLDCCPRDYHALKAGHPPKLFSNSFISELMEWPYQHVLKEEGRM